MKTALLVAVALVGLAIAGLGLAAALNLVSLRALVTELGMVWLGRVLEHVHALFSHRRNQGLELATGLGGLGVFAAAAGLLVVRQLLRSSRRAD